MGQERQAEGHVLLSTDTTTRESTGNGSNNHFNWVSPCWKSIGDDMVFRILITFSW